MEEVEIHPIKNLKIDTEDTIINFIDSKKYPFLISIYNNETNILKIINNFNGSHSPILNEKVINYNYINYNNSETDAIVYLQENNDLVDVYMLNLNIITEPIKLESIKINFQCKEYTRHLNNCGRMIKLFNDQLIIIIQEPKMMYDISPDKFYSMGELDEHKLENLEKKISSLDRQFILIFDLINLEFKFKSDGGSIIFIEKYGPFLNSIQDNPLMKCSFYPSVKNHALTSPIISSGENNNRFIIMVNNIFSQLTIYDLYKKKNIYQYLFPEQIKYKIPFEFNSNKIIINYNAFGININTKSITFWYKNNFKLSKNKKYSNNFCQVFNILSASDIPESERCEICFEKRKNTHVINPCGHTNVCKDCLNKVKQLNNQCPICRNEIISIIKLYN